MPTDTPDEPTPLSPAMLVLALVNGLATWAAAHKAKVSVARDPYEVLELLGADTPAGLRLVVHWAGDDGLGDEPEAPLSTNILEVILGLNLGLSVRPDAALVADSAKRPSLLALVGSLRARVLAITFPDELTEIHLGYAGTKPVVMPEGISLAAYRLAFTLPASIVTEDDVAAVFTVPAGFAGLGMT